MDERREKDRHQVLGILCLFLLFLAIGAAAFDPEPMLTKSIGGRVLKATIWSQGTGQVVRVTYSGDSLPDSISVALALGPGDTTRVVYKLPRDPAYDRALHEIYDGSR